MLGIQQLWWPVTVLSNRSTPRQMLDIRDAIDVAVQGNNKTCVPERIAAWCVEHNRLGQLGDGTQVDRSRSPVWACATWREVHRATI